jgi:tripeptide aminopeptidase
MITVAERFLRYISIDTRSNPNTTQIPSTNSQTAFALLLKKELQTIGLTDVCLDKHSILTATLPENTATKCPTIGFIAHVDTSPDMSGENVKPTLISNYNGENIVLNRQQNIILSPEMFPELLTHKGEDLIVTDGTTLLGADDKAGIAEIVTAMHLLTLHPEIKHGKVRVAFTPDEEIGRGTQHFDVKKFDCDFAFTVDGGEVGGIEYETFNAAVAEINFRGLNTHPGYAKNKMRNAASIASHFVSMVPKQNPESTDRYRGFYHLVEIVGSVEKAFLKYIVRDHNREKFVKRTEKLVEITDRINDIYPNTAHITITQQYQNMREILDRKKHIVKLAKKAMSNLGIVPVSNPIRGGTDGAMLSFKGLPCPNIFTGGLNPHGIFECVPVQSMEKAVKVIMEIVKLNCRQT